MLVKIESTLPEFLDVLGKNPNTLGGLQLRNVKNGTAIGFIAGPTEYDMVFQDTKYSFSNDTSNQIDFQSYCNPRATINLISEFLGHILVDKEKWESKQIPWLSNSKIEELDKGAVHTLTIENIYADGFSSKSGFVLEKYFSGIKLTHKVGNLYRFQATSDNLYNLVNITALCCMYMAATNKQPWFLDKNLVLKYMRIMTNLKPIPYFVIYLFAKNCMRSPVDFDELKGKLADTFDGELNLSWGSSQEMRILEVGRRLIQEDKIIGNVVEIGCGEMEYPNRLIKKLQDDCTWTAIDKVDYEHLADRINRKRKGEMLIFCKENDWVEPKREPGLRRTTLMIEVIEHMPYDDACVLLSEKLNTFQQINDRIIITTPNVSFNQHFALDKKFRHADHHFELTLDEFKEMINQVVSSSGINDLFDISTEFFGIGDEVDGDSLSNGCEITVRKSKAST